MLGLGCMRLSTEPDRDDARSLAVLEAAIAAGVTTLDTADAYAHDDTDTGHNERLIAQARRPGVRVVTKGGLLRPGGRWVPDGRAKHLAAAARASRDRLGVDALDVFLLHAIDPATPLATSVRALARLRDDGIARAIGLSNVTPTQLEEARAITRIDVVEIELSPWKLDAVRGGLVAACARDGIELLAHRPLGGPAGVKRLGRDPIVGAIAQQLGATPCEVALAWVRRLGGTITTLPGATRIETATSTARDVPLDDAMIAALTTHFLGERDEPAAMTTAGEVVLIAGMPGAGKSTQAEAYVARGYLRLNRDDRGGSLADLAKALRGALDDGATHVVLDNTYPTRASRAPVIAAARRRGLAVRCVVVGTSLEQAQANAVARMLAQHGRLLEPHELGSAAAIGPGAQFRFRRQWEPPRLDEGFTSVDEIAFEPRPREVTGLSALLVELDDLVWVGRPRTADAVTLHPGARDALHAWHAAGHAVAATSWHPDVDAPTFDALVDRLRAILDAPWLVAARCAHPAGPPVCWCRKPLPGLLLSLAHAHGFDLDRSTCVGRGPADRGAALRAGVRYEDGASGWPAPLPRTLGA